MIDEPIILYCEFTNPSMPQSMEGFKIQTFSTDMLLLDYSQPLTLDLTSLSLSVSLSLSEKYHLEASNYTFELPVEYENCQVSLSWIEEVKTFQPCKRVVINNIINPEEGGEYLLTVGEA